mgnify:CR=1 FL=1
MPCIEAQNLSKIYGAGAVKHALPLLKQGLSRGEILNRTGCTLAVHNVSFAVEDGEIFVVMGLSGCGKSTLLRCVNRLIDPTAGEVWIDGENVTNLSSDELRRLRAEKVAMVFQNFGLLPHRTVLENAAFGLEIQNIDVHTRAKKAREALELVGLTDHANSAIQELSGGMQQRVGLARALAANSKILLMDEAFSALDPLIRSEMQDELLDLQARLGRTIVFITHDLDEALKLGDRVGIMKDGRIVQSGTPEEILTHPADAYVRSFVENVDRSRVITAQAVMTPPRTILWRKAGPNLAMRQMRQLGLSLLFVVDERRQYKGIVRIDEVGELASKGERNLEPIVRVNIPTAAPDAPVSELVGHASQSHTPIPVVDGDGTLLGVVTRTAILSGISGEHT